MPPRRERTYFVCTECGEQSLRWFGRCPSCEGWNTLVEEVRREARPRGRGAPEVVAPRPAPLGQATAGQPRRYVLGEREIDRVLGGGLVPGSVLLLGGEPGIGKSTLLLQLAARFSASHGPVLYVSGEESAAQVALRAQRLGLSGDGVQVLCETRLEVIEAAIRSERPALVVVDSIQTVAHPDLDAGAGSVAQVRECANALVHLAKGEGITIFLVGHVNKQGALAGPKVLEHAVDVVLEFDGERHTAFRMLRAQKNRFGSTHEVGLFEMSSAGLVPVANPSEFFLAERPQGSPGSVVFAAREGSRPILVEIQALVAPSAYGGTPRRQVSGVDANRVAIVLAVLERRVGLPLHGQDVYINVAGGARLAEPACDLAVALAVTSSLQGTPLDPYAIAFGEIGLAGEVRSVPGSWERLAEAERLGFRYAYAPASRRSPDRELERTPGIRVAPVRSVRDAIDAAFSGESM